MNFIPAGFEPQPENAEDLFALEAFVEQDHILVPANFQLIDREFYTERAWRPAKRESRRIGGRKQWPHALTLNSVYKNCLFFPGGEVYNVSDAHFIFTDPDNRWMTNFLKTDGTGEAPASPSRLFERVRMISVYCTLRALQRLKLIR